MKKYFLITLIFFIAAACSNDSDPTADKANFTRIYDNKQFNTSFYPIDVAQTPDGGYLILGGRTLEDSTASGYEVSNFSGVYLMKVDQFGEFVSEQEVVADNIDPVGPLLAANGSYYFFCMTSQGYKTRLIQLAPDATITSTVDIGNTYPLAAGSDNGNFVLLSYDPDKKESVISLVTSSGTVTGSKGYTIGQGDAVEAPLTNHFIRNGRQFPFQAGKTLGGKYFFNGFYNYTFSLVFTDLMEDKPNAVQGFQDQGGLNQIAPLTADSYATSRFNFGDNYILPAANLSSSSVSSSSDLGGNSFPELVPDAPVKILLTKINSKDIILYASNTRSRQIGLYAYDKTSGKFLGSKYLGFSNPFEIASLIATADGGLAVCGTAYVAGRFPRICLFKFSQAEIAKSFQ